MSNAMGDRDGLMGAILAITAPPSFGNSDNRNKTDKSGGGQKKASRTAAKEVYCEGCGDTGDIILTCYDCSTTSYHPVCDDPPLEETEVKDMRWQCRSCRNKNIGVSEDDLKSSEQIESLDGNEQFCNPLGISDDDTEEAQNKNKDAVKDDVLEEEDALTNNPVEEEEATVASANDNNNTKAGGNHHKDKIEKRRKSTKLRKLITVAINTAKFTNPVLFELPKSFQTNPYNFPGTSRSAIKRPPGVKVKPAIIELENYCTPRPISCCFKCGSSCRTAPLMHCDYCPKYFHFDCLTPPLTTPPVGLWMCPLHPEHFMETKMLKTSRMSERVSLWNFTNKQVDRSSVELKFLSKCGRRNPPFARKIPWPPTRRCSLDPGDGHISVPSMDESNSIVPFMDKEKLESISETQVNRELYQCYYDAIQDFVQDIDLDGTDFASDSEIFSRVSFLKDKLETEKESITIKQEVITEEEVGEEEETKFSPHISDPHISDPKIEKDVDEVVPDDDKEPSLDDSMVGIDVLLEAASMSRHKKGPINKGYSNNNGPLNYEHMHSSLKDTTPALLEILFVDQKRKLSICEPQVFFGTGKYDHPNTAVIDPLEFVDCPRLSSYHAMLYFDVYRKQWEILNYSKHGISVDCTRYVLKQKPKKVHRISNLQTIKDEILRKRRIVINKEYHVRPTTTSTVIGSEFVCECQEHELSRCMNTIDNEGSAPIYQYSQIQIGCLRMIVANICGKSPNVVTAGFENMNLQHDHAMSESIPFDSSTLQS